MSHSPKAGGAWADFVAPVKPKKERVNGRRGVCTKSNRLSHREGNDEVVV